MNNDKESILYDVLSGQTKLKINGLEIQINPPSYEDIYNANILYNKMVRYIYLFGGITKDDILDILVSRHLWKLEDEEELEKLPEYISNTKLDMYETYTRFGNTDRKREVLRQLNNKHNELWIKKTQFDRFTTEGIANYHKICYLICAGADIDYYNTTINLDRLYCDYMGTLYNEDDIRDIARSNDWREYWRGIKLGYKIFGDVLTKSQYSLLSWSQFYDNIYENPDCPDDIVINDNDLLDGWCIWQKNKRKQEEKKRFGDKYGRANEVFIPVESPEQAIKVHEMNDDKARIIKKQRENIINQRGSILEQDLPDARSRMREQAIQEFKNRGKK